MKHFFDLSKRLDLGHGLSQETEISETIAI
jgi:hypothetical protein